MHFVRARVVSGESPPLSTPTPPSPHHPRLRYRWVATRGSGETREQLEIYTGVG